MSSLESILATPTVSDADVQSLVHGIHAVYGLDFRDYDPTTLRRRTAGLLAREGLADVARLLARLLIDPACLDRLVLAFTIPVTSMFRDPGMFAALRELALPVFARSSYTRIWVAGCSTGEEVYSLAILLTEEGLYERCRIYATDVNEVALEQARRGVYPLRAMREYTRNYQRAGGQHDFSRYYSTDHQSAALCASLRKNVVFARHDLARERGFHEFQLVLCRNVMIYFNDLLRERVSALLGESVEAGGWLVLGNSETVRGTSLEPGFEQSHPRERVFKKKEQAA